MWITWELQHLDVIISIFVYSKLPVPQYVVTEVYETKLIMCASSHRTLLTDLYRRLEC